MLGFGLQLCIHPTLGKGIWLAIVHHFALVHYPQIHLPTIDKVSGRKPYHRNPDIGILGPLPMADWWGFLAQSAGSNHCWLASAYPTMGKVMACHCASLLGLVGHVLLVGLSVPNCWY